MADIALTAAQVEPCYPTKAEIYDWIAGVAITKGQALYETTTGLAGVADANDSGKEQFIGIALKSVGIGQAVPVLIRGHVYGFTVAAVNAHAVLYLSNTAGALADAAGTMTVNVGKVTALPDGNHVRVVFIVADFLRAWS